MAEDSVLVAAQSEVLAFVLPTQHGGNPVKRAAEKSKSATDRCRTSYDALVTRARDVRDAVILRAGLAAASMRTLRYCLNWSAVSANLQSTPVRKHHEVLPERKHEQAKPQPRLQSSLPPDLRAQIRQELCTTLAEGAFYLHKAWDQSEALKALKPRFQSFPGQSLLWGIIAGCVRIDVVGRGLLLALTGSNAMLRPPPPQQQPKQFQVGIDNSINLQSVVETTPRKQCMLGLTVVALQPWEEAPEGGVEVRWMPGEDAGATDSATAARFLLVCQDEFGSVTAVSLACLEAAAKVKTLSTNGLHRVSTTWSVRVSRGQFVSTDKQLQLKPGRNEKNVPLFLWGSICLGRANRAENHPSPGLSLLQCRLEDLPAGACITADNKFTLVSSSWSGDSFAIKPDIDPPASFRSPLCPRVNYKATDLEPIRRVSPPITVPLTTIASGGGVVTTSYTAEIFKRHGFLALFRNRVWLGCYRLGNPPRTAPGEAFVQKPSKFVRIRVASGGFVTEAEDVSKVRGQSESEVGHALSRRNGPTVALNRERGMMSCGAMFFVRASAVLPAGAGAASADFPAGGWLSVGGGGYIIERFARHSLLLSTRDEGEEVSLVPPQPGEWEWSDSPHGQDYKFLNTKRATRTEYGAVEKWVHPPYVQRFKELSQNLVELAGTVVRCMPWRLLLAARTEIQQAAVAVAAPTTAGRRQTIEMLLRPLVQSALETK